LSVTPVSTVSVLTAVSWLNPIIVVSISLLIGTGLGIVQGLLAAALAAAEVRDPERRRAVRLDGSPVPRR
jgi:hypothetical protein